MHIEPNSETPPTNTAAQVGRVISVSGSQALVQLSAQAIADDQGAALTVGSFVGIRNRRSLVVAVLCEIALPPETGTGTGATPPLATARLDLLGEIVGEAGEARFERGVSHYPAIGSAVSPIGPADLRLIFNSTATDTITVGHLQQDASIGATLDVDALVRKHFAVLGSTGAGKSSATALILGDIMTACPDLRILMIDPHNEYGACFGAHANVVRPGNFRLPFWLFTFDEFVEVVFGRRTDAQDEISLLGELIPLAKNTYARGGGGLAAFRNVDLGGNRFTVDTPVPYRMDDLLALAEGRMGKLENNAFAGGYHRLIMRLNTARKNARYAFIFDENPADGDNMVDILCQLFRLRQDDGRPISVMQLAGFPAEVFDAIVSALFRLAFEFGLWSDGARPLLIVCEEAHHYANSDRTLGFAPAREAVSRIAKEGRKYGVFLGLVTQRPAELDPTLISQCSTVFAMRMGNEADQNIVRAAVSDPSNRLISFLPSLGTREAVAFGAAVPVAMRLRFRTLPDDAIPRSEAVWGGAFDESTVLDEQFVSAVVSRWRGTAASNKPEREAPAGIESILARR